jgi:hypothetical protein
VRPLLEDPMSAEYAASAEVEALAASLVLAEECFRHSWGMSDERRIDGVWVAGLCCECGAFVPYGQVVAHVAAALAPQIATYVQAARDEERARFADDVADRIAAAGRAHSERGNRESAASLAPLPELIRNQARGGAR